MSRKPTVKIPIQYEDIVNQLSKKTVLKLPDAPFFGRNPLSSIATPYTNRGKGTVLVKTLDFEVLGKTKRYVLLVPI
jgi:hypothetical protein